MSQARNLSFNEWLKEVQEGAEAADSGVIGACLVPNPQTGVSDCVRTDPDTCTRIGGTFMGGPCGPTD